MVFFKNNSNKLQKKIFIFKKNNNFFKTFVFNKSFFFLKNIFSFNKDHNLYKNLSNLVYTYDINSSLSIFNKNYLLMLTPGILLKFFKINSKSFKKHVTIFKKFIELSIVMCNNYYINILHKPFTLRVYLLPFSKRVLYNNYSADFFILRKKNRRIKK